MKYPFTYNDLFRSNILYKDLDDDMKLMYFIVEYEHDIESKRINNKVKNMDYKGQLK